MSNINLLEEMAISNFMRLKLTLCVLCVHAKCEKIVHHSA